MFARTLSAILFSILAAYPQLAAAEPAERSEITITRTATSGLELKAPMSRNVYRHIEREVIETVQVPYTVEVPYTSYETYYVDERVCDYRPRQTCHNENVCRQERRPRRECHNERRCTRDGHCTDRQVCREIYVHENVCRLQRVCRTTQVYDCWIARVPRTRPVTRYRTETHYRSETRRRTVTDRVFERSWGINVTVKMPTGSELTGSEQETLLLKLTGSSEADAAVEVQVDSAIFNYTQLSQSRQGSELTVTLGLVAKYDAESLGEQTIVGLAVTRGDDGQLAVRFDDLGIVSRVHTKYLVAIGDRELQRTVFEAEAEGKFGNRKIVIPVNVDLQRDHDHVIRLTVHRDGVVLDRAVDFTKATLQVGQLDPAPYSDVNGVREFEIEGEREAAILQFTDATPRDHKVDTRYDVTIKRKKFLGSSTLGTGTFERKDLRHDGENTVKIDLAKIPGVTADELRAHAASGDQIMIEIQVMRSSPRLAGSSPIRFKKTAKVKVH